MIKFGDTKAIAELNWKNKKNPETCKITIDMKKLIKAGVSKEQALNLIERLLKLKK